GNAGRVETDGIDVQLDWGVRFSDVDLPIPGRFSTNIQFTYLNKFATTADEVAVPLIDYAGTTGGGEVGTQAGSYRWKLFTRFHYSYGPVAVGLQWRHLPSIDHVTAATRAAGTPITGAPGGGEVGTQAGSDGWKLFTRFNYSYGPVTVGLQWRHLPSIDHGTAETREGGTAITGAPAYDLFNLSGSYTLNRNARLRFGVDNRSEEHTSELQSRENLVCRLLLEKKK